jgi:type IV secretory pathway VirB10-like protein
MNWLLDHLQIVVIVVLALGSWLKHRADTKNAEAEERRAREEMSESEDIFGPDKEWRAPQERPRSPAPPPLFRQAPPPLSQFDVSEVESQLKRQQELQDRLRKIKETKSTTTGGASATRIRVAAAQTHAKPLALGEASLKSSLKNPKQTRRAIILREILGTPLGLR